MSRGTPSSRRGGAQREPARLRVDEVNVDERAPAGAEEIINQVTMQALRIVFAVRTFRGRHPFYDVDALRDPQGFRLAIDTLAEPCKQGISLVVGIESRGSSAARRSRIGSARASFRCARSASCRATIRVSYSLECGSDSLEMHSGAIDKGQKVLIVDDLLAAERRATVVSCGAGRRPRRGVPDRAGGVERTRKRRENVRAVLRTA